MADVSSKEMIGMGDIEIAARVAAVQRLQRAEARLADAIRQWEAFDADAILSAAKGALATDVENAKRECELARDEAAEAGCDEPARAAVESRLAAVAKLDLRADDEARK